jgi:hypothetical protein
MSKFDPYRYYLNKEKIPWTKAFWIIFGISIFTFTSWILGLFWVYHIQLDNPLQKLSWYLVLIWVIGGAFVFVVKYTEQWDESLIDGQNGAYFTSKFHNRETYRLILPEGQTQDINYSNLFISLNHSLKTANATKENDFNMGKKPLSLFFDFIAENSKLKIYVTMSGSKVRGLTDAMTRHCPHVKLERVDDPLKFLKDDFKSKKLNLDHISGFSLSLNQSNLYPVGPTSPNSHPQESIQNLLKYMVFFSANKVIALQYGFLFSDGQPQDKYQKEFDKYMLNLTNQYNSKFDNKNKSVEKLFPESMVKEYNSVYKRLHSTWFMAAIRTICYDKSGTDNQKQMESMFSSFIESSKLPLSINYLTSTRQTYYRFTKENRQPEADEIYNNMVFPPAGAMENWLAPIYDTYYYPQESRLRKGTMLRSIYIRNPMQPWHPKFTWMDTDAIKYYFCLQDNF